MSRKTVVITEIIAPYRIPVFNALARHEEIDLHVVFLAETDEILRQWRVYKDEIRFSYEVLPSLRLRLGKHGLLLNWRLWSCLKRANPEVILFGGYNYVASWEALLWARRRGIEFALWSESNLHDSRARSASTEFLKKYFVRRCDRFIVPGSSSFDYQRSLGSAESDIFIAPDAVDNSFFAAHAGVAREHADEFRQRLKLPGRFILFVGRLVREKGVLDLLDAYARLDCGLRSAVGLVFAGDGVLRAELSRRAQQISPGAVCFPGFLQREDLAVLYALSEVFVLPTRSDPWGLVVNEAMACGLPVIVTNVAGCAADLVEDNWNGYIVPARDPDRLSFAINSVLGNPELKPRMGAHSLERIRNYTPESCAKGLAAAALPVRPGVR